MRRGVGVFCDNRDCVNYFEDNCVLAYCREISTVLVPADFKTNTIADSKRKCEEYVFGRHEVYEEE